MLGIVLIAATFGALAFLGYAVISTYGPGIVKGFPVFVEDLSTLFKVIGVLLVGYLLLTWVADYAPWWVGFACFTALLCSLFSSQRA
jgi:hypothetical protein